MKAMHAVLIGGAAIGGYFLFRKFFGPQTGSYATSPYSQPQAGSNLQFQTQPSQLYPVQPIVPPRVDNSSQPWYAGDRSFSTQAPDSMFGSGFSTVVSDFKNVASLGNSLSSIYDDLGVGSWFSDESSAGSAFGGDSYDSDYWSKLGWA